MNIDQNKPYDWCSFKTFKKEFNKYINNPKLYIQKFGDYSIFLDEDNRYNILYLHASIIKFNDKCMILYPFSWLRYCIWKINFTKSRIPKNKSYRQKDLFVK